MTKIGIGLESAPPAGPAAPPDRSTALRRYVGPPGRLVHITELGEAASPNPSLYCLHATAYSGRSFFPFMQALSSRRRVLAPDTPGYGASDSPARRLDIPEYAAAMAAALTQDSGDKPIDLLGYHTGALIAAELARQRPELVRRLVLVGVPFFLGAEREHWRRMLAERVTLTEDLAQFEERWGFFITRRPDGVSLDRGFENFVDELRAYPRGWWAHEAAFTFDAERCFPEVLQPSLVVNPRNHLSEASRRAAACMPCCRVAELPQLAHGVFDAAPKLLADIIDSFLAGDHTERGGGA